MGFLRIHIRKQYSHIDFYRMKRGPIHYLFALCGKAILFFLYEQYKEITYLLRFLDSVHGGCQYCLVFPMGTWESAIPGLVPSFSAPYVTFRSCETTLKTRFICLRSWNHLSLLQRKVFVKGLQQPKGLKWSSLVFQSTYGSRSQMLLYCQAPEAFVQVVVESQAQFSNCKNAPKMGGLNGRWPFVYLRIGLLCKVLINKVARYRNAELGVGGQGQRRRRPSLQFFRGIHFYINSYQLN